MAQNNAFTDAFKGFSEFKLPNVDFNSFFSLSRRNIEAFTAANQAMSEGVQAVVRRQAEITQRSVEDALALVREVYSSKSPEASASKQAQFVQKSLEEAVSNARELIELASKSGAEASEVLSKRFNQAISEITEITSKTAGQAVKAAKSASNK